MNDSLGKGGLDVTSPEVRVAVKPIKPPVVNTGASAGQSKPLTPGTLPADLVAPKILTHGQEVLAALKASPDWAVFFETFAQERYFKLPEGTQIPDEDLPKKGVVLASIGEGRIDWVGEEEMAFNDMVGSFQVLHEVATENERTDLLEGLYY